MQKLITKALKVCQVSDLNGRSYRKLCAKSIIYHELRKRGLTMHGIAMRFNVTHCSVINLLKKYDDRLFYDPEFKNISREI